MCGDGRSPVTTSLGRTMDKGHAGPRKEKPDPQRMAVLRALPLEIKQQITGEEAQAFLYNEDLPESLLAKLKDYLVDPDSL
jgi:hypothetical protein